MEQTSQELRHPVDCLISWYSNKWRGKARPTVYRSARVVERPAYAQDPTNADIKYTFVTRREKYGHCWINVRENATFVAAPPLERWVDPSPLFPGILHTKRHKTRKNVLSMTIPWEMRPVPRSSSYVTPRFACEMIFECSNFYRRLVCNNKFVVYDEYATKTFFNADTRHLSAFLDECMSDMPYSFKRIIYDASFSKFKEHVWKKIDLPRISDHVQFLEASYHSSDEQLLHPQLAELYQQVRRDLARIGYEFGIFPAVMCDTWEQYELETCNAVRVVLEQERAPTPVVDVLSHISEYLPLDILGIMYCCTSKHLQQVAVEHNKTKVRRIEPGIPDRAVEILAKDCSASQFFRRLNRCETLHLVWPERLRTPAQELKQWKASGVFRSFSKRFAFCQQLGKYMDAWIYIAKLVAAEKPLPSTVVFVRCLDLTQSYHVMRNLYLIVPDELRPIFQRVFDTDKAAPVDVFLKHGLWVRIFNEAERPFLMELCNHPAFLRTVNI